MYILGIEQKNGGKYNTFMKKASEKTPLYELRKKRGLTQKQIAEALGTLPTQISKLENGERKLAPEWIERLSKVLDCTKAELLGETPQYSRREQAFVDMFRTLTDSEQLELLEQFYTKGKNRPSVTDDDDKKAG